MIELTLAEIADIVGGRLADIDDAAAAATRVTGTVEFDSRAVTSGGLFLGLPGLILGPFVGAVVGEMISHGKVEQATRAGLATWMGLIFGTLAKLALVFTMLGVFALAYFV